MKAIIALILTVTLSPIWPLGQNPLVGDPYIIINKQTNELAYFNYGDIQEIYPVATGVSKELTPEGEFSITVKAANPYYRKKNIPGGSPDNPLGSRWMGLNAAGTDGRIYGIHGTNNEQSISKYITGGCVRMYNRDVEFLFTKVPVGTKVLILKTDQSFEELGKLHGAIN
ncbi:L,D-transpeptidase [Litchfieldia salsa]|uniref:L,D-transpeptidase catalytic domain n=1 Tax=Litchfieldia salsa TaxID=930152 RepID=A0A1H0WI09_9BACI|nr:L,D-transpeptidase [Litchfieldia salsa]SDP90248.1 L,D-transpeptidase catalytic domain [Litchfieldia salsa]